jgi:hypothetical protein
MFRTALAVAALVAAPAFAQSTPSPDGAEVYLVGLEDGATLTNPRDAAFRPARHGCRARAGVAQEHRAPPPLINRAPFGADDDGLSASPADDNHRHFGGGQTEVTLDLPAGTHTLQLVLGDLNHVPHDPPVTSEVITITVE